jgi:quinol monooxygenase YgiN
MRALLTLLAAIAFAPMSLTPDAQAQEGGVYVVSYIDVAPASADAAAELLRQLAEGAKATAVRLEILRRTAPANQFAIVSVWKDQKAYEAHSSAPQSKHFRDKIKQHLISAIDDRVHGGMDIAATGVSIGHDAIHVLTHVDVPPPRKDDCISALQGLVAESRNEAGAARFEVFQQTSRPNHFSVVEVWSDQRAYEAHITAPHTIRFREQLTPMSGALYDERLYRAM